MPETLLQGFHYDGARAVALADLLRPTLLRAAAGGATTPDLLAGLGLAAAEVITASPLRRDPHTAARSLAEFIAGAVGVFPSG